MPRKSTKSTRTSKTRTAATVRRKTITEPIENNFIESEVREEQAVRRGLRFDKRVVILVIIAALAILVYYKKGWFIAATVNSQPISNVELTQRMYSLYKGDTLKQLINEKILEQEATKNGVYVSQAQINQRAEEDINKQYGSQNNLDQAISQQGVDKNAILSQLKNTARIELLVEGLYGKEASPTAEQIDQFKKDNANIPEATDTAKFQVLAADQVKQENLNKIIGEKFQALKSAAKIQTF